MSFLPRFVAALLAVCSLAHAAPPNVIIILADDLGRGDYSAFGTKDIRTPNMDRLFHEGVTFENFYANSPVCSPSRAALMSGCHPDRVGVPGMVRSRAEENWAWLSPKARLLPQLLKTAGYHTALVGKWNLGLATPNLPNERGFDHFHGFLDDMMEDYWTHLRHGENFMRLNAEAVDPKGHATDIFTDWACEYLDSRAGKAEPFFLYLAYNAPHDPIQPKPDWLAKVQAREPGMPANRQKLVALVEHLDDGIGQVLARLDKLDLAKNTLVFFTSDNGGVLTNGANNGPWRSGKTHMYEGGLRVPCAARWPGHIKPGSDTGRIALHMDVFATILDAAGVKAPAGIDGISFLPTLLGETQPEIARDLYFTWLEGGPLHGGKAVNALRQGDWKLLQDNVYAPLELYNLSEDPQEQKNVADQQKDVFRKLSAALRLQSSAAAACHGNRRFRKRVTEIQFSHGWTRILTDEEKICSLNPCASVA